jgi:hypothetical protein
MKRPRPYYRGSETKIADVIIVTGLNYADEQVQVQALEVSLYIPEPPLSNDEHS